MVFSVPHFVVRIRAPFPVMIVRRVLAARVGSAGTAQKSMVVDTHKIPETSPFLTVVETAQYLKVSEKTVYRLLQRGLLKAQPMLRHKKITVVSVRTFATATG